MAQSKEVHKEYMRRRREGSQDGSQAEGSQQGFTRYDHDYTALEIQTLTSLRTQDQKDRFPMIPLPFGEAYYNALKEQKRT